MKFGEELEDNLVSAWRDKYLDYKTGKRLVKSVAKVISHGDHVPDARHFFTGRFGTHHKHGGYRSATSFDAEESTPLRLNAPDGWNEDGRGSIDTRGGGNGRLSRLSEDDGDDSDDGRRPYTPGQGPSAPDSPSSLKSPKKIAFQLSGPPQQPPSAMQSPYPSPNPSRDVASRALTPLTIPSQPTSSNVSPNLTKETPKPTGLRRFPTGFKITRVATQKIQGKMHPLQMMGLREREFFTFMDSELEKVERFYQQREEHAKKRLDELRLQLHIMRDQRSEEIGGARSLSMQSQKSQKSGTADDKRSLTNQIKSKFTKEGPNTKSLKDEKFTPLSPSHADFLYNSDYVRKPLAQKVPYRTAKHRLRLAIQEYYRGLELLKSYALMNRTAFRKLNKKFDKAVDPNARPTLKWFHQTVEKSIFVNSKVLDECIDAAEDLYTRYLERGNHKLAVGKLRQLIKPKGDKSESALFNGLLVGVGLTFAGEGVWWGFHLLKSEEEHIRINTSFLLQIYAGYFLMLYLFTWFCLDCRIWAAFKVNYAFIFEFDPKHDLDWRQLSNFPCFFTLLFGLTIWFNFEKNGHDGLFLWYPVILIGITLAIILCPLPILRWRSRKWFAIAHWRLLLAGIYPVEFRDFFLGDMYCSLTYAIANAEMFFCLYVRDWDGPARCSSKKSILVAVLSALPPLWRASQCIRRYMDSKHAFPHIANFVKYAVAVATPIALGMYRLDDTPLRLSIYICVASINAFYSLLWDVFMDFSLLGGTGKYFGLREVMGFDKPWMYYGIMIVDPILRFAWVPIVIFTHNIQHGSYVVFLVAFAEVTRRGMWALFRVENEHCTHIGQQKASRDVPLPYSFLENGKLHADPSVGFVLRSMSKVEDEKAGDATPLVEAGQYDFRRTRMNKAFTMKDISKILADAHKEDFQKKRRSYEDSIDPLDEERGMDKALQSDEEENDDLKRTNTAEIEEEVEFRRRRIQRSTTFAL